MKAFKKILSLCLAGVMCVGSIGFADTSDAAAENDAAYTRAHSFLKSLSLLGDTEEKEPVALVTRAEFAAWILNVIGISTEESKKRCRRTTSDIRTTPTWIRTATGNGARRMARTAQRITVRTPRLRFMT